MDLDPAVLTDLAEKAAAILAPYLLGRAEKVGEAVADRFTNVIAEGLWGLLTRSKKKDRLEEAAELRDGKIDAQELAAAIREALQADADLRETFQQTVTVHGNVVYGNYTRTGDIRADVSSAGDGSQAIKNITNNYYNYQADLKEKITPPILPPTPYYAHPYGGGRFTGRAAELKMLDDWAAETGRPVMAWIAIGGMGKSALAWHWSRQHAGDFEGVLWWSFYDATFQAFLDAALTYCGKGLVDPAALQGGDRVVKLVDLLREGRFLLVLDGFERELDAYRGLNAAYQGDTDEDEHSEVGNPRLEAIHPQARDFLTMVGVRTGLEGKVLLTSRLFPNALADRFDTPLDGVRREELVGLKSGDAVALFHELGVDGTRSEIETACDPLGYHPFSLRLLAGHIVGDKRKPGDISVAPKYPITAKDVVTRRTHMLKITYGELEPVRQQFLGRMAAFRAAMDYAALTRIMERGDDADPASDLSDAEEAALDATLEDLLARGLIFRDEDGRYNLHPIVRRYAYERLLDPEDTHARLRDYFAALPDVEGVDTEQIERLEDLLPVIELYHHTLSAGDNDAAIDLYYDRLAHPLHFRLGAYATVIGLLRPLFADGESLPPRLTRVVAQAYAANALAASYSKAGQPVRAIHLKEVGNAINERQDDKRNLAVGLGNLALEQRIVGGLEDAAANSRRGITLAGEAGDERSVAIGRQELGLTLAYVGNYDEAGHTLDAAQVTHDRNFEAGEEITGPVLTRAHRAELSLLQGKAEAALAAAGDAQGWNERMAREWYPVEREFIHIAWLLGAAHRALGDVSQAEGHLTEALARSRRINLVELEAVIMLELAHLRRDQRRPAEALELAEEAWVIAERAGYRLQQADIQYLLALLAQDRGDTDVAKDHAQKAREYATCEGKYDYQRTLDQAEALLKELG